MTPETMSGGWIEVITGCMFSGKTEEVIRRLERAEIAGQDVTVFKPDVDDRYGEAVIGSHRGREYDAEVVDVDGDVAGEVRRRADGQVVAIDEVNFFDDALVDACQALADEGYRVVAAGTDQTFRGEPFEPLPHLAAVAEYVEKRRAVCARCGDPASRNQRLIDGEPAHADDPTIVTGAEEKYEARCRDCHTVRS